MSFNIWRISDGKAGHDSQSLGLCNAIKQHIPCNLYDIPAASCNNNLFNYFFKRFPAGDKLPDPKLIVGAGHKTHLPMLTAKRARGGKTIVLMKPSLPRILFDYCIIPKHDRAGNTAKTIFTNGAINTITASQDKNEDQVLVLVGGPSRHFDWDNKKIVAQILRLVRQDQKKRFVIIGSRRTPGEFFSQIDTEKNSMIDIYTEQQCDKSKLNNFMCSAKQIWVSEDSVSMVYEALSSGAEVGLLELTPKQENKISASMKILIEEGQLTPFYSWENTKTLSAGKIFNEAKRCTEQLAEMGAFD